MSPVTRSRTLAPVIALTLMFLAATAAPARADITAFLGLSPTPERHTVKGFAAGLSLVVVGFEFEFGQLGEDPLDALPGLKTYSGNVAPAFILTAPIWLALAPKAAAETRQVEAWKAQYNPLLIPLPIATNC